MPYVMSERRCRIKISKLSYSLRSRSGQIDVWSYVFQRSFRNSSETYYYTRICTMQRTHIPNSPCVIFQKHNLHGCVVSHRPTTPRMLRNAVRSTSPHVSSPTPIRRHVATGISERRNHDFVVRSHFVVFFGFCGHWRFLDHQHVHQRVLQHQQQSDDPREFRVPSGARRQLWRTAGLHAPTAVQPGRHNEPVYDATQYLHYARDNR